MVFAVDGTKEEIQNSEENRKTFGIQGNQYGKGQPRVLVSDLYNVTNDFFVNLQIYNLFFSFPGNQFTFNQTDSPI